MIDYSTTIEALKVVDQTKPYGTALFDALARLTVSVAVEAVYLCLNKRTGNIEVYLVQRSQDDTAYPGEWHCPGSVMRPGEGVEVVFDRLAKKEFGTGLISTRFVANINHPTEARGHFFSLVYLCVLEEKANLRGKWFPVDALPFLT
ncbi:NUDIX domain-containing protein, partial [Patescibacteria group bacterium]|nr:NUDIX domain-containing protein [Patescibacteria group bacterium]